MEITKTSIRMDNIKADERYPHDPGYLKTLAASIEEVGLLRPIMVDEAGTLIGGSPRLEACKLLGWKEVPVTVVSLGETPDAFFSPDGEIISSDQWLNIRKQEGLKIDPNTAEVTWWYAWTLDPYGVHPDLPEEYHQAGREQFARSPGSEIWVWFGDLPMETADQLREKHKSNLAFPAGLPLRRWAELSAARSGDECGETSQDEGSEGGKVPEQGPDRE